MLAAARRASASASAALSSSSSSRTSSLAARLAHSPHAALRRLLSAAAMSAYRTAALRRAHASGLREDAQQALQASFGVALPEPGPDAEAFAKAAAEALASLKVEDFSQAVAAAAAGQPYQNHLRFDLGPEAIAALADELMARMREAADAVAAVPEGQHTYENTVGALEDVSAAVAALGSSVDFPGHVSPDKAVRDASSDADTRMSSFYVEQGMREDVYRSVLAFSQRAEREGLELDAEQRRAVDHYLRDFRRNGLHLGAEQRARVEAIKKELSGMGIKFSKNLAEDKTELVLTEAELEGTPADLLKSLERDEEGRCRVSMDYPHYFPVMKFCRVAETRRRMEFAYNTRCLDENPGLLERAVALRHELAQILGFPDFASYQLETRMAKTPETVQTFLRGLSKRLEPLAAQDLEALLALKRAECEERGEEFDGRIHMWDYNYYARLREEREFSVDHQAVQGYFPLETAVQGMMDLYQRVLGLRFRRVDGPHVWHPDVQYYEVTNAADGAEVGGFYLDLHPREGKYSHAAMFSVQPGCVYRRARDGQEVRQLPVAAMVANFTKPTEEKPSLLTHGEVVTLLHEQGHVMHHVCSLARSVRFSGTHVERDFVEAPSQMLEFNGWTAETLSMLSGHYKETGPDGQPAKLPEKMLADLMASKNASGGLVNKRQLVFGLFDQTLHTQAKVDTAAVFADTVREVSGGLEATPGTNFAANFGHLMGGYEAQYYGYMWAQVYAADMFLSRFGKEGPLNEEVGLAYRREVLAPGGSRDAIDSLRAFLGREPNDEAFCLDLGLGEAKQ